jgi:hypothetical protein
LAEKNNSHWSFISKKASFEGAFFVFLPAGRRRKRVGFAFFAGRQGKNFFISFLTSAGPGGYFI